jgi:hypothetical protein
MRTGVDEDVDESAIPSFTAPGLSGQLGTSPITNSKGKKPYRPEQLVPAAVGGSGSSTPTPQLSGTIGSPVGGYREREEEDSRGRSSRNEVSIVFIYVLGFLCHSLANLLS